MDRTARGPDESKTSAPQERLGRWNRTFNPVVVIAAILPLGPIIAGDDPTTGPGVLHTIFSWLVFALDFGVRNRLVDDYLRSWRGRLYVVIVVVTFPVYLLVPGLEETDLLAVTRLECVAALAVAAVEAARNARILIRRIGVAGLYAAAAMFVAAVVVPRVEEPEDGFDTFGDALWWATATITTVRYRDRVPVTTSGRVIATLLMIARLAFLGVIAASLTALFGLGDSDEIRALRAEDARLSADIDRMSDGE